MEVESGGKGKREGNLNAIWHQAKPQKKIWARSSMQVEYSLCQGGKRTKKREKDKSRKKSSRVGHHPSLIPLSSLVSKNQRSWTGESITYPSRYGEGGEKVEKRKERA